MTKLFHIKAGQECHSILVGKASTTPPATIARYQSQLPPYVRNAN
ncbi:hypothetical protein SAMN05421507_11616 [Lentzea jiangxiensis]|uniref:Uncharacterized protein n=1 Tax=Lentzea jiangxiensis TaxID=641025 RepID=A0A1H0VW93_9PSEU|nr:hypothetical protein SAMN05421507_11616 [Lentzea jiangxiensis]